MGKDHEKIRARAYDIWDRDGRQNGRDQEYWLQAERELGASDADRTGCTEAAAIAKADKAILSEAPAKAQKTNGAAKAVAAKAAPRKRRGSQPASQA
jgi:hypothetical protein